MAMNLYSPWYRLREGKMSEAQDIILLLHRAGYAASDIIQTLFRVGRYGIYHCIAYKMHE